MLAGFQKSRATGHTATARMTDEAVVSEAEVNGLLTHAAAHLAGEQHEVGRAAAGKAAFAQLQSQEAAPKQEHLCMST